MNTVNLTKIALGFGSEAQPEGKRANNMLVLSVGLGDTAVPLFWKNIDKRGNSHAEDRRELLERFFRVFGHKNIACVLGDREFASQEFMRYLQQKNILFAIRVKDNSYAANAKGQRVKLKNCYRIGVLLTHINPIPLKNHGRKAKSIFKVGLDFLRETVLQNPRQFKHLSKEIDKPDRVFPLNPELFLTKKFKFCPVL